MTIEISFLIAAGGFVLAILGYIQNRDAKKARSAESDAEMRVMLRNIGVTADNTNLDVRGIKDQMNTFGQDIARLDESVKVAHKRIDKIEGND